MNFSFKVPAVSGWEDSQYLLDYDKEEDKLYQAEAFDKIAVLNYQTWILRNRDEAAIEQSVKDLVIDMQMKSLLKGEPDVDSIEIHHKKFYLLAFEKESFYILYLALQYNPCCNAR